MKALDFNHVKISKFIAYYLVLVFVYFLIAVVIEHRYFPNPEFTFTSGMLFSFIIQFLLLILRIYFIQRRFRNSGEIQTAFSFLSIFINFAVLIFLLYLANNFSVIFGFFIAHNLNMLNIALITNLSVKQND